VDCELPTAWTENALTACPRRFVARPCELPAELQEQLQHQRRATSRSRATLFTKPSRRRIGVDPVSTFLSLNMASCDIFVATPVPAYLRRLPVPRPALPERGRQLAASPASDRSPFSGHSRDSSHQRIPWRICSDFDRPVRAVIEVSRSSVSGSIKNVQRVFLPTIATRFQDVDGRSRWCWKKRKQGACHRHAPCDGT
jgi:hypothetical protein